MFYFYTYMYQNVKWINSKSLRYNGCKILHTHFWNRKMLGTIHHTPFLLVHCGCNLKTLTMGEIKQACYNKGSISGKSYINWLIDSYNKQKKILSGNSNLTHLYLINQGTEFKRDTL